MEWGGLVLDLVSDGTFCLDGGAMFGVVPKPLWERGMPADERNRVRLGLNCLLVRGAGAVVLVETGLGGSWDEKFAFHYQVEQPLGLLGQLARLGVGPEDVTGVVLTHLHFDHAGGACSEGAGGGFVPTFPKATYYLQQGELIAAKGPDRRSRPSYWPHTWEPLEGTGQLRLVEGRVQVGAGIEVVPAPGHTLHHQMVVVRKGGRTACFLGDLVPTSRHLKPHYVMAYDLYPKMTMENKGKVLAQAAVEDWLLFFVHDPVWGAGYLGADGVLVPEERLGVEQL